MKTIAISTYIIRVKPPTGNHYFDLDDLPDGSDLFEIISRYLEDRSQETSIDNENERMLKVNNCDAQGRTISGFFDKGEYGIESDLIDRVNDRVSYVRQINDAEMIPFYFLFILPTDSDEGILALQKSGLSGIKTYLEFDLKNYIYDNYPDIRIEINRLVPDTLLDQYFGQGRVTKIRFVKFGIPSDITDRIDIGHEENEGMTELQIKAKRGSSLQHIKEIVNDVLQGRRDVSRFIEMRDFEYDNVKIELNINGKYRTINLLEPESLRADYDISDTVELQGGHPTYESINDEARRIVRVIAEGIGFPDNYVQ